MRLHILSDLHLEFASFAPPTGIADAVILAGDIHPGRQGLQWVRSWFPNLPVIYVLGNHEFYGQTLPKLTEELRQEAQGTNIHILENGRLDLGEVTFLGATLWTDFGLYGDPVKGSAFVAERINDFQKIRTLPQYKRLAPNQVRSLFLDTKTWLSQKLAELKDRKVVVVTHHAPSAKSVPPALDSHPLNAAFASDLDDCVAASQARLWVHGHIHATADYVLGKTRVIANPRGYPDEIVHGFQPDLVLEV